MMNYVDMSMINKIKEVLNKVYRNLENDIKIYIFKMIKKKNLIIISIILYS